MTEKEFLVNAIRAENLLDGKHWYLCNLIAWVHGSEAVEVFKKHFAPKYQPQVPYTSASWFGVTLANDEGWELRKKVLREFHLIAKHDKWWEKWPSS